MFAATFTEGIQPQLVQMLQTAEYGEWQWFSGFRTGFGDESPAEVTLLIVMRAIVDAQASRLVGDVKELVDSKWTGPA